MSVRKVSLAAVTLAVGGTMLAPAAAMAAPTRHCDAYSRHCTNVQGHKITKPPTVVKGEKVTLPFTGAEIVLMTVAGGAALGAGTVLVVGARRRRHATPA